MDTAGAGVQALQQALVAGTNADLATAAQSDGYSIDAASLSLAATQTGGELVSNETLPYRDVDSDFGGMGKTIEGPLQADGSRQFWQVVQALPPVAGSPYLTLYVRGWRKSTSGNVTDASVMKARLKPGTMADFQLLSDVPIALDAGAQVNGRIHSNGGIDESSQPPAENLAARIWSNGAISCVDTAGIKPVVSTSRGKVDLAGAGACAVQEGTGEYVRLDSGYDAVKRMRARDSGGATDVTEFASADTSTTPATVVIGPSSLAITYPGMGSIAPITTSAGKPYTLVFDRDVEVRGSTPTTETNARVTIATWTGRVTGRPAPSIIITGNIRRGNPAEGPRAIGLLAEGDIVLDPSGSSSSGTYPSVIQAALLSATGGVRLPWRYRTPVRVTDPAGFYPPQRGSLQILGSIASHSSIAMRWSWGSDWIGWTSRDYAWDSWLATYPPPYWPAANPWEIVDQVEANADCYGASANAAMRGKTACR